MIKILVPILPNSPTELPDSSGNMAEMSLWENKSLGIVENRAFDPNLINYDENYQNFQGLSAAFGNHMAHMADIIQNRYSKTVKIVEIGCGKGDFLKLLWERGFENTLGFDASYDGNWDKIKKRYLSEEDQGIDADIIILRHTLEHIQDPFRFLQMIAKINNVGGDILVEVPCFDWIRNNGAFFDITYEHVNYFSMQSLCDLFNDQPLEKGRVFEDQYIYIVARLADLSDNFGQIYYDKTKWEELRFRELFPQLEDQFKSLSEAIGERPTYIWGAATKGCLFLHHLRHLDEKLFFNFRAAIDINPKKTGKFLPGTAIPIIGAHDYERKTSDEDVILVSNPNYYQEISGEVARINAKVQCILI